MNRFALCFKTFFIGIALSALATVSIAQTQSSLEIKISEPIAAPTRAGQPNAAAFLEIKNQGKSADRLIGFTPPAEIAERGELHVMKHEGGVMMMREVKGFDLAVNATLKLSPGGNHLMLIGIKKPLKEGDQFTGVLRFEKAGEVKVQFKVAPPKRAGHSHG